MSWFSKKFEAGDLNPDIPWHPSSGKWGFFETKGSKNARLSASRIREQQRDVEGRKESVEDYFSGLQALSRDERDIASAQRYSDIEKGKVAKEASEQGYLSTLEDFLAKSYTIGSESDARVGKKDLATLEDPQEQFMLQMRRNQIGGVQDAQRLRERAMGHDITSGDLSYRQKELGFKRGELQLGMEETRAMQDLRDQLFQLEESLQDYT